MPLVWQCFLRPGDAWTGPTWADYTVELNNALEVVFAERRALTVRSLAAPTVIYIICTDRMVQMNAATGRSRPIRRVLWEHPLPRGRM